MSMRFALAVSLMMVPAAASAATINGFTRGAVSMGGDLGEFETYENALGPVVALSLSDARSIAASGPAGSGSAAAQYSVDAVTGQIRFGVDLQATASDDPGPLQVSSGAYAYLSEEFRIVGAGLVTVGMEVSAEWLAPAFNFFGIVEYLAISAPLGSDQAGFFTNAGIEGSSGSFTKKLIELSFLAPEGTDALVRFDWSMYGEIFLEGGLYSEGMAEFQPGLSYTGFFDAMNTANIFVRTSGDVTATPVTAGFLSDPAYGSAPPPAVVPLPASGVLLMLALGGAGLARRRSKAHGADGPALH